MLFLSACQEDDTAGGEEGAEDNVTEGDTVTVSSQVVEVLSDQSFRLEGADGWVDDDPLLVVSANQADVGEGDVVTVTGTVQEFDYTTYSEDYGLGDAGLYEEFDGEQFLMADDASQDATPGAE